MTPHCEKLVSLKFLLDIIKILAIQITLAYTIYTQAFWLVFAFVYMNLHFPCTFSTLHLNIALERALK